MARGRFLQCKTIIKTNLLKYRHCMKYKNESTKGDVKRSNCSVACRFFVCYAQSQYISILLEKDVKL